MSYNILPKEYRKYTIIFVLNAEHTKENILDVFIPKRRSTTVQKSAICSTLLIKYAFIFPLGFYTGAIGGKSLILRGQLSMVLTLL